MTTSRPGPVLVTGANSGIGLAHRAAARGARLTVYGTVRERREGRRRCAMPRAEKKPGWRVHADRARRLRPRRGGRCLEATSPDFYAVVNNAGYSETGAVEEVSAAQAKAQLDVNLVAPGGRLRLRAAGHGAGAATAGS